MSISPTGTRYQVRSLDRFLDRDAFYRYAAQVELAYLSALAKRGHVPPVPHLNEGKYLRAVPKHEAKLGHEGAAVAAALKEQLGAPWDKYIHLGLTASDVQDTANALRYRDAVQQVVLPAGRRLARKMLDLANRHADTLQLGRTHGQAAEPITFGFALAWYADRWCIRLRAIELAADHLVGKLSGSVGSYNALRLIDQRPQELEDDVLDSLHLTSARVSTQIVQPEAVVDLLHAITSAWGVMAGLADDLRHLARTEIGEIAIRRKAGQTGSSSMPGKENPVDFENIKSAWKEFMPRMVTTYMDQLSEHQRDLTNSLTGRYVPETICLFTYSTLRMLDVLGRTEVNQERMLANLLAAQKQVVQQHDAVTAIRGNTTAREPFEKWARDYSRCATTVAKETAQYWIPALRSKS